MFVYISNSKLQVERYWYLNSISNHISYLKRWWFTDASKGGLFPLYLQCKLRVYERNKLMPFLSSKPSVPMVKSTSQATVLITCTLSNGTVSTDRLTRFISLMSMTQYLSKWINRTNRNLWVSPRGQLLFL